MKIRLSKLPYRARQWHVEQLVDYFLDQGFDTLVNDKLHPPYLDYQLSELLDDPSIWERCKEFLGNF